MPAPQVEDVSDSDPDVPDPEEDDIQDVMGEEDLILQRRSARPPPVMSGPSTTSRMAPPPIASQTEPSYRHFQSLYPVYFDASRSRQGGRRVSREKAVRNPLARTMADACSRLGLRTVLEMDKTHPKDWSNPGRVKVELRASKTVRNKHQLYVLVASYLASNPTTESSPGLMRFHHGGSVVPDDVGGGGYPRPAVPRGVKMGELLPWISPALTGGGVSDNLFGDMMREMQQQQQQQGGDDSESGKRRRGKARIS
ncbi:hypothetical protein CP532_1266 [Ophiocordyceps camponoti-leonardi (nom. inval.)]|nr:hypothetical protein CP532_1266 [Ophiocordyceps camponoti-leonardi (nom. inval.)]